MEPGLAEFQYVSVRVTITRSHQLKEEEKYVQVCPNTFTNKYHFLSFSLSMYIAIPTCKGKTEDLVLYPTTPAPESGSETVTTVCADNANAVSSTMNVSCHSDGRWTANPHPQCRCNDGYRKVTKSNKVFCQGF